MGPVALRGVEQGAQGGVHEQRIALGPEDADGVSEVLDDRVDAQLGTGRGLAARKQLLAHRAQLLAELAELVLREIERRRRLAALQALQTAAQDVDRPQQPLREEQRAER